MKITHKRPLSYALADSAVSDVQSEVLVVSHLLLPCALLVRSIRPLVGIVEHLRRELAWGMPIHRSPHENRNIHVNVRHPPGFLHSTFTSPLPSPPLAPRNILTEALEIPARELGDALLQATKCVEKTIVLAFHQAGPPARLLSWTTQTSPTRSPELTSDTQTDVRQKSKQWTYSQMAILHEAEASLTATRDNAREALRQVFHQNDLHRWGDAESKLPQDVRNCSLAMIALLQVWRLGCHRMIAAR